MADNRLAEWIHDTDLASQMTEYTKQRFTRNEILVYLRSGVIYKNYNKMGSTMPAKSLGTLPVIYAVDKQQNPLPHKTMLCYGAPKGKIIRNFYFILRNQFCNTYIDFIIRI